MVKNKTATSRGVLLGTTATLASSDWFRTTRLRDHEIDAPAQAHIGRLLTNRSRIALQLRCEMHDILVGLLPAPGNSILQKALENRDLIVLPLSESARESILLRLSCCSFIAQRLQEYVDENCSVLGQHATAAYKFSAAYNAAGRSNVCIAFSNRLIVASSLECSCFNSILRLLVDRKVEGTAVGECDELVDDAGQQLLTTFAELAPSD